MKNIIHNMVSKYILTLLFIPAITFSQQLTRKVYNYDNIKTDSISKCDSATLKSLQSALVSLNENNSAEAVRASRKLFSSNKNCPYVFDAYGYSLFRSGEWLEGVDVIEKGIEEFGSIPDLIKRRSEMSLEMAELGIARKNIDGTSVYVAKAKSLPYDEVQFKEENLKSALIDLEYLAKKYGRAEEVFKVAKIHQLLKHYDQSTTIFKTLLTDEDFKASATFNIADNYINLNKLDDAESVLAKLINQYPREWQLYDKVSKIYDLKKDSVHKKEFFQKATFYKHMPAGSDLDYSTENFETLRFFASNQIASTKKIKKLNEIFNQGAQSNAIDVCLMVLQIHTNHGNGVEERATELLEKIGKPAIDKVHQMFQSDVSTCTITNLADVMATVKDEKSWQLLTDYLPYIAQMPMTLIPPAVPEMIMKFDEAKGLVAILKVVKPLLTQEENGGAMADIQGFGQYVYFTPLKKVSKTKLKKIATELNYSDEEFMKLQAKLN